MTAVAKSVQSIVLVGRRWFNRGPGNTYHSVAIYVNGECVHKVPFAYGYGDQYIESAAAWLETNGYVARREYPNGGHDPLWRVAQVMGFTFSSNVSDVARRKDL